MYSRAALEEFAAAFKAVDPNFPVADFLRRVFDDQWESRELKQRTHHIAQCLRAILPPEYHAALAIMRQAAPHLRRIGFLTITFSDYVEMYGLDDWDASIPALEEFNRLCTSEWAVRPFILRNPQRMMAQMLEWAQSEDVNSRRLASEGCRPRLPWGISLPIFKNDPTPILPILEQLKLDESEDVRNSAMDITKYKNKDVQYMVLDEAISCPYKDTKEESLFMLEYVGGQRSVDILIKGLQDNDNEFREEVKTALNTLFDEEFETYEQAKSWWEANRNRYDEDLSLIEEEETGDQ